LNVLFTQIVYTIFLCDPLWDMRPTSEPPLRPSALILYPLYREQSFPQFIDPLCVLRVLCVKCIYRF
jgi:hypothetical protein